MMDKYVNDYVDISITKLPIKNTNDIINENNSTHVTAFDQSRADTFRKVDTVRSNIEIRNMVTPIFHHYKKTIMAASNCESGKEIKNCEVQNQSVLKAALENSKEACATNDNGATSQVVIQKPNYSAIYNKEYPNSSVMCNICKKYFSNEDVLAQHKKNHSRRRNLKCEICSKTFARWDYFNRHLKAHSMNESFACHLCGETFGCLDHQKMHMRTHARKGYIKCEFCEETFEHMDHYKKHLKVHETFPISCNYCSETFMRLQELRQHMHMKHTGEHNFRCDLCGQTFTRSYHLDGHVRTVHNGEHPFKCNVCNKIFTRLAHMQVHVCGPPETFPFSMMEISHNM